MADIVLKTFNGGNVTPQDDAIIYETVIPGAGVFKGCDVTCSKNNIIHLSQGYGMIKGRFFELYENEVSIKLANTGETLNGRIYIHLDLSNADEPIQIKTETAETLSALDVDEDVNYNNTAYDLELATFTVDSSAVKDLKQTFSKVEISSGNASGRTEVLRETDYEVGDTVLSSSTAGWCTLSCTQAGTTDVTEPVEYSQISKVGDTVTDGTCIFEARRTFAEIDELKSQYTALDESLTDNVTKLTKSITDLQEQTSSSDLITQKFLTISDYQALETYDKNTMYYCYDNEDNQAIKYIFIGEHTVFATGIKVIYQLDTDNQIEETGTISEDLVASAPTVNKDGYTFVGWKTDTSADKNVLTSYVLNSEDGATLYAVFKKEITLSTDSGEGSLSDGKEDCKLTVDLYYNNGVTLSDKVIMPANVYDCSEGKIFSGWKISLSDDNTYLPEEEYQFTKEEVFVPSFIDIEYDYTANTAKQVFSVPADGIYEFECWGAAGGDASGTITVNSKSTSVTAAGGKGGHVKAYRKCKKGTKLYVYNGGKGSATTAGRNGGAPGVSQTTSSTQKNYGAAGGGATHISTSDSKQFYYSTVSSASYEKRGEVLLIAGGGGGGGVTGFTSTGTSYGQPYVGSSVNVGGYGGGEKGEDGSGGNLGGRQTSTGSEEYTNWSCANYPTSSISYALSGGGGGWFGGEYGVVGNSGAGGSSYVGNMPSFTHKGKKYNTLNEANINDGAGYTYIRFIEPCVVE